MSSFYLFLSGDLFGSLENQKRSVRDYVQNLSAEQIRASSPEQIIDHVVNKFSVEPLTLFRDRAQKSLTETTVETRDWFRYGMSEGETIRVPGVGVTVRVPYTGEPQLLRLRGSLVPSERMSADVSDPVDGVASITLDFRFAQEGLTEDRVKQTIDQRLNSIEQHINGQGGILDQYQRELTQIVQEAVHRRSEQLGGLHALAKALDIPIVKRPGTPMFEPIPVVRRARKELPPVADNQQSTGFAISDDAYLNILRAIRAQGRTFEKAPQTFHQFEEEQLRDTILANLNTHFEGGATGETFRAKGKTDICVEQENRAAFIGECKIWSGSEELVDGLKQLLGYLTWRDCKTALIVFNKDRAKFSELLVKAPEALRTLSELFVSERKQDEPGEWQMRFRSLEDAGRIVTVQLMLYNIYARSE